MEIHQLRYFCAVAATGSFTGAAELEGISQPSLSQQIRKLEQTVGAPLFTRLGRRIRLTPAGEALHEHAQEILRHSRDASQRIRQLGQSISGPLRVGAIPTVLPYLLAPRLTDFVTLYPEVQVELKEETTTELVKQLQQGEFDVILVALPLRVSEVVCSELVRDPLMLAVPKNHPLAGRGGCADQYGAAGAAAAAARGALLSRRCADRLHAGPRGVSCDLRVRQPGHDLLVSGLRDWASASFRRCPRRTRRAAFCSRWQSRRCAASAMRGCAAALDSSRCARLRTGCARIPCRYP